MRYFPPFPLWKRLFDLVFSSFALVISFPLWLLIPIAIKAEDGGPIFFSQYRVMEGGRRFKCLKFRSMRPDAETVLPIVLERNPTLKTEWLKFYKLKQDPRVTKTGKFLRRFNLDELPQFINVISGDMSVVGARPVVSEELIKYYRDMTLVYCTMKPGITGPWQVSSQRETIDYETRVALDRGYILNCSICLDVVIIAQTVWRTIFK